MRAGDKVVATSGPRKGQEGKLVEPTGVEVSWVKWRGGEVTTYPHRSLGEKTA